ncbi:MAG: hypothetical protein J4A00_08610 [Gammaproteobacteria bacterium]|nr:hypothetical protein [Gammaproteobacteria bacterium]
MQSRERWLSYGLILFGLIFLLGVYPLMYHLWPSGWRWQPPQTEYEEMIIGIYSTLGLFLLWASRAPRRHMSLIWFTVWSSLVHGGIMAWQASVDVAEHGHFYGDIPALILVAVVLGPLAWRLPAEPE